MQHTNYLRRARFWLTIFIVGLVLSGVTAFPLQTELRWMLSLLRTAPLQSMSQSVHLLPWIERVYQAVSATNREYPFWLMERTGWASRIL